MSNPRTKVRRISRARKNIQNRLEPLAINLDKKWQTYCETKLACESKAVKEHRTDTLAGHWHYGTLKGVRYYDLEYDPNPEVVDDSRVRKAVLNYNTCIDVCFVFWNYLLRKLKAMTGFKSLELKHTYVDPSIVIFDVGETPGRENVFRHNYMLAIFEDGIAFVFDFSGYQFGFDKVLYKLSEFEHQVMLKGYTHRSHEIEEHVEECQEMTESENWFQRSHATQLLDFAARMR